MLDSIFSYDTKITSNCIFWQENIKILPYIYGIVISVITYLYLIHKTHVYVR